MPQSPAPAEREEVATPSTIRNKQRSKAGPKTTGNDLSYSSDSSQAMEDNRTEDEIALTQRKWTSVNATQLASSQSKSYGMFDATNPARQASTPKPKSREKALRRVSRPESPPVPDKKKRRLVGKKTIPPVKVTTVPAAASRAQFEREESLFIPEDGADALIQVDSSVVQQNAPATLGEFPAMPMEACDTETSQTANENPKEIPSDTSRSTASGNFNPVLDDDVTVYLNASRTRSDSILEHQSTSPNLLDDAYEGLSDVTKKEVKLYLDTKHTIVVRKQEIAAHQLQLNALDKEEVAFKKRIDDNKALETKHKAEVEKNTLTAIAEIHAAADKAIAEFVEKMTESTKIIEQQRGEKEKERDAMARKVQVAVQKQNEAEQSIQRMEKEGGFQLGKDVHKVEMRMSKKGEGSDAV